MNGAQNVQKLQATFELHGILWFSTTAHCSNVYPAYRANEVRALNDEVLAWLLPSSVNSVNERLDSAPSPPKQFKSPTRVHAILEDNPPSS